MEGHHLCSPRLSSEEIYKGPVCMSHTPSMLPSVHKAFSSTSKMKVVCLSITLLYVEGSFRLTTELPGGT